MKHLEDSLKGIEKWIENPIVQQAKDMFADASAFLPIPVSITKPRA
jgi:hypothetical protein